MLSINKIAISFCIFLLNFKEMKKKQQEEVARIRIKSAKIHLNFHTQNKNWMLTSIHCIIPITIKFYKNNDKVVTLLSKKPGEKEIFRLERNPKQQLHQNDFFEFYDAKDKKAFENNEIAYEICTFITDRF